MLAGADGLVSSDPALVRALSGVATAPEDRYGPFVLEPLVIAVGDRVALVCAGDVDGVEAFTYPVGTRLDGARAAFADAVDALGLRSRRMVVDDATVPAGLRAVLPDAPPAGPELWDLTALKGERDVERVAAAVACCDAGQAAARTASAPGASAGDVLAAARAAIGARTPLLEQARLTPRGDVPLAPGDLVLCDLAPRVDGTWGDSAATFAVGEPTARQAELHALIRAALDAGIDALRPGAAVADVDRAMRDVLAAGGQTCPHHLGHGVGFSWHDAPRVVPDAPGPVTAGMVVALEPAVYTDSGHLRVEQVVHVTSDGPRVLSDHDLSLGGAGA